MKRNLFLLLSFFFSTLSESQTVTTVSFDDIQCTSYAYPGNDWNCSCVFDQVRTIQGVNFKATHGSPFSFSQNPYGHTNDVQLDANNYNSLGPQNAGFIMYYNFKKDYTYKIKVHFTTTNIDNIQLQPGLEIQLTQTDPSLPGWPCTSGVFVSPTPTSNPDFILQDNVETNVTPQVCYPYLWFVSKTTAPVLQGTVNIYTIEITEIDAYSITNTNTICSSEAFTLNLNNQPWTGSVNWAAAPSGIVSLSQNNNAATLSKLAAGMVTLQASFTEPCGAVRTLSKEIAVGTPIDFVSFTNAYGDLGYFCSGTRGNTFSASPALPNAIYTARIRSWPARTLLYTDGTAFSSTGIFGYAGQPNTYVFELQTVNACGTSNWHSNILNYEDCSLENSSISDFNIVSSPNPANSYLDVTIDNEKPAVKALDKNEIVYYTIYSFYSTRPVREWQLRNNEQQQRLNVSGIQKGQYILLVRKGKFRQSKQVIIK